MRAFKAFFRKELTAQLRTGKLIGIGAAFLFLGILAPATAKLLPKLLEAFGTDESGFTITMGEVTAFQSWQQFFKNAPLGLIVFLLMQCSIFTNEYRSGTLVLTLTKGLERSKVLFAKTLTLVMLWTAVYWMSFFVTYGYTAYLWSSGAENVLFSGLCWYAYGLMFVSLSVLFSAVMNSGTGVLAGLGGVFVFYMLLGLIPKLSKYLPSSLSDTAALLKGEAVPGDLAVPLTAAILISIAAIAAAKPVFDKRTVV